MNRKLIRAVRDLDCGSSSAKAVALVLATYADDDGICWPSQPTIAAGSGLSESSVKRAIKALAAAGIITIEGGHGRGNSTRYRFASEAGKGSSVDGFSASEKGSERPPLKGSNVTPFDGKRVQGDPEKGSQWTPKYQEEDKKKETKQQQANAPRARACVREAAAAAASRDPSLPDRLRLAAQLDQSRALPMAWVDDFLGPKLDLWTGQGLTAAEVVAVVASRTPSARGKPPPNSPAYFDRIMTEAAAVKRGAADQPSTPFPVAARQKPRAFGSAKELN